MSDKISFDKKDLICQMCKEPYYNPIFIPTCGHHCCKDCLLNIIKLETKKENRKCVICRTVLPDFFSISYLSNAKINFLLQNMVMDNFSVECENGCGFKLLDYQQETHNNTCINYPIQCSNVNNGCLKKIQKKNIYNHLEECEFHACIGRRYGCRVIDTKINLIEHQDMCQNKIIGQNIENKLIENFNSYIDEKIKKYNDKFQRKNNLLNSKLFEQNKKMLKLTTQLNKLKEKLELYNILPSSNNLNNTQNNENNENNENINENVALNNTNIRTSSYTNTYNTNLNTNDLHLSEEEYDTDNDMYQEYYDDNETIINNTNQTSNISNTTTNPTTNSTVSNTAISNAAILNTVASNAATLNTSASNSNNSNFNIVRRHTIEPLVINVSNRDYNRQGLLQSLLNRIDNDISNILNESGTFQNNNSNNSNNNSEQNNPNNGSNYNTFTHT